MSVLPREHVLPHTTPLLRADRERVAARTLDLIIPALNEERRIAATIRAVDHVLSGLPISARIVVVDNGSVDNTVTVARSLRTTVPVEVISAGRRGKGAAVRAGILYSSAQFVAYCDADLSTPPSHLERAVTLAVGGSDLVIGSRRVKGAEYVERQPITRRAGSTLFRLVAGPVIGDVSDSQCGFKVMRGDAARSIFAEVTTDGFAFDVELIALTRRCALSIVEMPVSWTDDRGSTFRVVTDGVRAFRDLGRVRRLMNDRVRVEATRLEVRAAERPAVRHPDLGVVDEAVA